MAANPNPDFTLEEYYALESASERRWEYRDGEVVCMSGGSQRHGRLCTRIVVNLQLAARRGTCETFTSDTAVATLSPAFPYCYPDASVACAAEFPSHQLTSGVTLDLLLNPVLIAEVVSPSSSRYDRGGKFELYKSIPAFVEYLLIEQNERRITHWQKTADDWIARDVTDGTVRLVSVECELQVSDLYEGVLGSPAEPHSQAET